MLFLLGRTVPCYIVIRHHKKIDPSPHKDNNIAHSLSILNLDTRTDCENLQQKISDAAHCTAIQINIDFVIKQLTNNIPMHHSERKNLLDLKGFLFIPKDIGKV